MKYTILAVGLLAGSFLSPSLSSAQMAEKDIVDTAIEAGSFTTLATALEAAGLVDVLKGEGRLRFLLQQMQLLRSCLMGSWSPF